jgi:protein-tyrosine-phosphatase
MLSRRSAGCRPIAAPETDASDGGDTTMSASERTYNALFLCTGNSARSILAEAILNRAGHGRFRAYSAGSFPKGQVHPMALDLLRGRRYETDGLRSKSWDEFAKPGAPALDFVFTVCDNAAGEVCPVWPGQPMTAHWGIADPAAVEGTAEVQRRAFDRAYQELARRIELFLALPLASIDRMSLKGRLDEIGKTADDEDGRR